MSGGGRGVLGEGDGCVGGVIGEIQEGLCCAKLDIWQLSCGAGFVG